MSSFGRITNLALNNPLPSVVGFLFGGPTVAGVEVSVLISESYNINADVTTLTMESGAQVSDHIINNPNVITIVCEVSNAGLWRMSSKDVFEKFKKMIEKRDIVKLITEHYTFNECVITNVSPVHAAPYKGRLQITLTLQEIYKVKLNSLGREPQKVKTPTASGETNAGEVKPQDPAGKKSVAVQLREAAFGVWERANAALGFGSRAPTQ